MIIKSKKSSTHIILVVVLTLVLTIASIFIFLTKSTNLESNISSNLGAVNNAYLSEKQMNAYLQSVFDYSASQTNSKKDFLDKAIGEIGKARVNQRDAIPDLDKILAQLIEDNLAIDGDKINIKLAIFINQQNGPINIIYKYTKIFELKFGSPVLNNQQENLYFKIEGGD